MAKKKPRPAKANSVEVGVFNTAVTITSRNPTSGVALCRVLTPRQAKRLGRKLEECAEYLEELGK